LSRGCPGSSLSSVERARQRRPRRDEQAHACLGGEAVALAFGEAELRELVRACQP
jgi:hypothetical protein